MRAQRLYIAVATAFVLWSCCAVSVSAYPVFGEQWVLRQPDGSTVDVRIWGDEYYQVVESLDGFTLVRDPSTRVISYARLSLDGNHLISTGVRVGTGNPKSLGLKKHLRLNSEARNRLIDESRRAWELRSAPEGADGEEAVVLPSSPVIGDVQGLVILVDFDDQTATVGRDAISNMFNKIGYNENGNNGSVRDYFYDVSNGMLNYTNWVTPTYYRAQYPFAHYDNCDLPWPEGPFELIVETLDYLEANGLDFAQFDADGDGFIDAFAMMYAGTTHCGWAKGMWPGGGGLYRKAKPLWVSASGVALNRGQFIGTSTVPVIGGFCHETGHSVCRWPDLYDYHYDSEGIGRYCLMANFASSLNPVEPCAYLKYIAGWGAVTTLTVPQQGLIVPTSSTNTMFKFEHPALANEYYLIENRRQTGRDAKIPDNGLAVWHIDTNGWNSWNQMLPDQHFLVTLVQADGRWDMEMNVNEGDDTDLYGAPAATELTPDSDPSSGWWDGSRSGLYIENVSASSASMTFDYDFNLSTTISVGDVATVDRTESIWVFRVGLENSGPNDAYNVVAAVSEDLPWLSVRKASCKYGDLAVGGDAGPKGVYLLASDSKSWPGTSFSAELNITWETQWGGAYSDIVTLVFDPPAEISISGNDAAVAERHRELDPAVLSDGSETDAPMAEAAVTRLEGNYPNPFNPSTTIRYQIAENARVSLDIYDATGRLVRRLVNQSQPAGSYSITWAGRDESDRPAASGVYFCRLTAGDKTLTKKMILLK